jgi:hypothetical protein
MRLRIWWLGLALFLVWAGLFTWGALESGKFQDSPFLLFFVQTFAGNWSPPKPDKLPSSWFVVSAAIAVALNLGTLGVLGANLVSSGQARKETTDEYLEIVFPSRRGDQG